MIGPVGCRCSRVRSHQVQEQLGAAVLGAALAVAAVLGSSSAAAGAVPPHGVRAVLVAPGQFADDGLGTTGSTTYVVDPAAGVIHVTVDLTATNLVPPDSRGYTYFDAIGVFTLGEATNLAAVDDGGRNLGAELEPVDDADSDAFGVIRIDLANQLLFQETHTIHLSYDLPDQGPRSTRYTRVNAAFAAVLPIPFGDPGSADIRVIVPDSLDVEVIGESTMRREDTADQHVLVATAIADPLAFDASIAARDLDALERRDPGGAYDVEIAAWPGDGEWAVFVGDLVRDGLPILEDIVGQPWPLDDQLEVVETVAPYLYGYGGWYDSFSGRIEVGDALEPIVVLHELAHAWFDDSMFTERWLNEGFADEMAARTLEQLGQVAPVPEPIDPAAPGAVRLADWDNPTFSDETSDETEDFGYNASFSVIRSLTDEIGLDATALVIEGAADERIAYQGDPEPESSRRANDWRRFLDLAEELGGSTQIQAVVAAHVVSAADLGELEDRTAARTRLDDLEAAGGGWTAPLAVREEMANWDFDDAEEAMDQALAILEVRDDIRELVAPLGLDDPGDLEEDYERADDLGPVLEQAEDALAAAQALVEADEAVSASRNLFQTIGLLGADPEAQLQDAVDDFTQGDLAQVEEQAAEAIDTIDGATRDGQLRSLAVPAALLVGVGSWRGLRHRRRQRAALAPTG